MLCIREVKRLSQSIRKLSNPHGRTEERIPGLYSICLPIAGFGRQDTRDSLSNFVGITSTCECVAQEGGPSSLVVHHLHWLSRDRVQAGPVGLLASE